MKEPTEIISCKLAAKLFCESLDHELPLAKKIALKTHLALCKTCTFCYRQIKTLRAIVKNYDKAVTKLPPPPHCCLCDETKKRIKECLEKKITKIK